MFSPITHSYCSGYFEAMRRGLIREGVITMNGRVEFSCEQEDGDELLVVSVIDGNARPRTAEAWVEGRIADVLEVAERGVRVVVGLDSPESAHGQQSADEPRPGDPGYELVAEHKRLMAEAKAEFDEQFPDGTPFEFADWCARSPRHPKVQLADEKMDAFSDLVFAG